MYTIEDSGIIAVQVSADELLSEPTGDECPECAQDECSSYCPAEREREASEAGKAESHAELEARLWPIVHKLHADLGYIAPEDVAMQKTKIFYALVRAATGE